MSFLVSLVIPSVRQTNLIYGQKYVFPQENFPHTFPLAYDQDRHQIRHEIQLVVFGMNVLVQRNTTVTLSLQRPFFSVAFQDLTYDRLLLSTDS